MKRLIKVMFKLDSLFINYYLNFFSGITKTVQIIVEVVNLIVEGTNMTNVVVDIINIIENTTVTTNIDRIMKKTREVKYKLTENGKKVKTNIYLQTKNHRDLHNKHTVIVNHIIKTNHYLIEMKKI